MTKKKQIILTVVVTIVSVLLTFVFLYFSTFLIDHFSFTSGLFDICHCENEYLPKFKFDYGRLGEGVNPVYHFENIDNISNAVKDLEKKSGIYLWHNNVNGDTYIGSAVDLKNRLSRYGHPSYLAHTKSSMIINSLNKYPLYCWDLIIIEIVAIADLINRETFWIKSLGTNLNILREAANTRLGTKHKPDTITKMSLAKKGEKHNFF